MVWMDTKGGQFSIKSFYDGKVQRGSDSFPARLIWNSWAPIKVRFFVWEATWKGIPTMDNLKRRGWTFANRCFLCKGKEFCNHILLHYFKASLLWWLVFSLFRVAWVLHTSVQAALP